MEKVPIRLGRLRTNVREAPPAAVDIRVRGGTDETHLLRAASSGRVCRVCTTHESRYTCPRCNLPYCSVDCYRSHGTTCTEQFYHEHVTNEMAFSERATASDDPKLQRQRKTQELLTRVKQFQEETAQVFEEDDDTTDEIVISAERLAQLTLLGEDELCLDCLTPEERAKFLADVAGGKMSKYVMPWEPWWLMSVDFYERETATRRRKLIVEVIETTASVNDPEGGDGNESMDAIETARFPSALFTREIEAAMPKTMETITRGPVSPCLKFHLVELMFAYAFMMRTFNGDWRQDPEDAALTLLHGSDVLREDARFMGLNEVVLKCLEQRDVDGSHYSSTNRLLLSDASAMLFGKTFVLDALTDMKELVREAAKEITKSRIEGREKRKSSREDRLAVKKLLAVEKKIAFYRAWRFHSDMRDLSEITDELQQKLDELALTRSGEAP